MRPEESGNLRHQDWRRSIRTARKTAPSNKADRWATLLPSEAPLGYAHDNRAPSGGVKSRAAGRQSGFGVFGREVLSPRTRKRLVVLREQHDSAGEMCRAFAARGPFRAVGLGPSGLAPSCGFGRTVLLIYGADTRQTFGRSGGIRLCGRRSESSRYDKVAPIHLATE